MELLPFQNEAVEKSLKFLAKLKAVYNASEMGLGKTIMSIETVKRLKAKKVLVLCPPSVIYSWISKIKEWHEDAGACQWDDRFYAHNLTATYYIVSWGVIQKSNKTVEYLKHENWDVIIGDEIHKVKSEKSNRTKTFFKYIWPNAKYHIYLSGTPFTQSIADCWTIFNRIMPDRFPNYWAFCAEFTNIKRTPWANVPTGVKNAERLKKLIRSNFFIRYKKADKLKGLPPRRWSKIVVPQEYGVTLTEEEREDYIAYIKELAIALKTGAPLRATPPKSVMTLRKEQALKRVKFVSSFVKDSLDQQIPVVLFFHHVEAGKAYCDLLKEYDPVVVAGSTPPKARAYAEKAFQEGLTDLFIGSITAAGIGITLTRSQTEVFSELTYSPGHISQAADRCHRIGQTGSVNCYYFEVENSVDTDVMDILIDKAEAFNKVLG